MNCLMERLDVLMPRILPFVLPCPKGIAMDALAAIAADFCKSSGVWRANYIETLPAGCKVIAPVLPRDAVMDRIIGLCVNGARAGSLENTGQEIILGDCADADSVAEFEAVLRPLRNAASLPANIIEEYGDTLAYGALAKIKAMSGQKIDWTDPAGAQTAYALYQEGSAMAKSRMMRKRTSGGIAYVKTGDW